LHSLSPSTVLFLARHAASTASFRPLGHTWTLRGGVKCPGARGSAGRCDGHAPLRASSQQRWSAAVTRQAPALRWAPQRPFQLLLLGGCRLAPRRSIRVKLNAALPWFHTSQVAVSPVTRARRLSGERLPRAACLGPAVYQRCQTSACALAARHVRGARPLAMPSPQHRCVSAAHATGTPRCSVRPTSWSSGAGSAAPSGHACMCVLGRRELGRRRVVSCPLRRAAWACSPTGWTVRLCGGNAIRTHEEAGVARVVAAS
jgi:hypothetical protein